MILIHITYVMYVICIRIFLIYLFIYGNMYKNLGLDMEKILDIFGVRINNALLFIFMVDPITNLMGGLHHECEKIISFSIFREYLKNTL